VDRRDRLKESSLSVAVGLAFGPLIGLLLINLSNMAYLETSYAMRMIALGVLICIIIGRVMAYFLRERLSGVRLRDIRILVVITVILAIAEIVVMLRQIIP